MVLNVKYELEVEIFEEHFLPTTCNKIKIP